MVHTIYNIFKLLSVGETSYSNIILDATVRFLLDIIEEKLPARLVRSSSASLLEEMSNLSLP